MSEFCERARAAIAADRVTLVASVNGMTNLAASTSGEGGDREVLSNIIADLARAIVSIVPQLSVSIDIPGKDPLVISAETQHIDVTRRVIEEVEKHGNMG